MGGRCTTAIDSFSYQNHLRRFGDTRRRCCSSPPSRSSLAKCPSGCLRLKIPRKSPPTSALRKHVPATWSDSGTHRGHFGAHLTGGHPCRFPSVRARGRAFCDCSQPFGSHRKLRTNPTLWRGFSRRALIPKIVDSSPLFDECFNLPGLHCRHERRVVLLILVGISQGKLANA